MDPHFPPILKLLIPAAGVAIILFRFGRRDILKPALIWPSWPQVALWTTLSLAWMFGTDALIGWRGPWDFGPWEAAPLSTSIFRVLGVCFFGPAMEELIFRGFVFGFLLRTPLKGWGTVVLTAAAWSVLHYDYSALVILVIFIQGLILGTSRLKSGSVLLPILLHCLWNLYAVW